MMKLDLSKFKKVKSNEQHTIMRNESGHEIKIAHDALSPKMRQSIMSLPVSAASDGAQIGVHQGEDIPMADGGDVKPYFGDDKDNNGANDSNIQKAQKSIQSAFGPSASPPSPTPMPGGATMARGGKASYVNNPWTPMKKMADGGQPSDDVPEPDPKKASEFVKGATTPYSGSEMWSNIKSGLGLGQSDSDNNQNKAKGGKIKKMADGGQADDNGMQQDISNAEKSALAPYMPTPQEEQSSGLPPGPERATYMARRKYAAAQSQGAMAKGGSVKDPTQQHLLPGDAIPNAIEKQVVGKAKKMDDGGEVDNDEMSALDAIKKIAPIVLAARGGKVKKMADGGSTADEDQQAGNIFGFQPNQNNQNYIPGISQQVDSSALQQGGDNQQGPVDVPEDSRLIKVDNQIDPNSKATRSEAVAAQQNPAQVRMREIYNQQLLSQPGVNGAALFGPNGEPPTNFDPMAWSQAQAQYGAEQKSTQDTMLADNQKGQAVNALRQQAGLPPLPVPSSMSQPQSPSPQTDGSAQLVSSPGPFGASIAKNISPDLMQGYGKVQQALQQEAAATGKLGQQEAGILGQQVNTQENSLAQFKQHYDDLNQERQNFIDDIQNQQVDPNHYLNSLGTVGRIRASIGLILGGMGAGLTHQANPVLSFINNQIDRDIQSQQLNLGKSENLLNANYRQFGNLKDATDMTRVMQGDIVVNQLKQAAAQAQTPLAKANALKAAGELELQYAPMFQQLAMRRAALGMAPSGQQQGQVPAANDQIKGGLSGVDPASFVPFLIPQERQAKALDEIAAAQNTQRNASSIMDAFDKAAQEVRPLSGGTSTSMTAFVPGMASANQKALHALMGPTFQDVEGTVRQAAMDNMNHNTTPQFGDSDATVAIKRNALQDYLRSKSAAPTNKAFGIDLSKFASTSTDPVSHLPPQQQAFARWAMQNPQDKRSAMILKKLKLQ